MNDDERYVKDHQPDAQIIWTSRGWLIVSDAAEGVIGQAKSAWDNPAEAWRDAAQRIRAECKHEWVRIGLWTDLIYREHPFLTCKKCGLGKYSDSRSSAITAGSSH